MRISSLIFINFLFLALGACVAPPTPSSQGVNPAPVTRPATAPVSSNAGYLDAASLNLYRLLPPPPVAGSTQERAELDELLHLQATRTPTEAKRAVDDATVSIFRFADALGSPARFTPAQVPLTAALFERIGRDEGEFVNSAKDRFGRPRPYVTEPHLSPVAPRPASATYPSGHTTWGVACAIVLADMIPERRAQLFARADEYGHNRAVAGVHYPSDVAAGHLSGAALAVQLFHSPRFLADEAAATIELRQAMGLPPKR